MHRRTTRPRRMQSMKQPSARARMFVRETRSRMKTSGESCGAREVADPLESRLLKPKEPGGFYRHHLPCSSASELRVTVDRMEVIEAEFNDGVLRPVRRL